MNIKDYNNEIQTLNNELMLARSTMSGSYIGICNRLVRAAKRLDDNNLVGYAYYYMADAYYLLSTDYRKFNQNLLKAIEYLQAEGDKEHLARCYNLLGIDSLNHGNSEMALDFFMRGIKYCEDLPNSGIPGFMEFNIGHIYYTSDDMKSALSYVRSAYKHIRQNRKESLYYRNILFCYLMQIGCYIKLGKRDSVLKCLESIRKLSTLPNFNIELLGGIPVLDTKMRASYFLGDTEEFEKCFKALNEMIKNNNFSLDDMEDVCDTARFYLSIGRIDDAINVARYTEDALRDVNISNIRLNHARLRCEIYQMTDNQEEKQKALEDFFSLTKESEKEKMISYKFFARMREKLARIEKENNMLQKKAQTDELTGLGNRYGLNQFADHAFEKAYERGRHLAVELLDVDNFKEFNDTYGHQVGDLCLKHIAGAIKALCDSRSEIHGFRYGGDEFVIIYENMKDDRILDCARAIREKVADIPEEMKNYIGDKKVSISQGIRNSVPQETSKLWDYMYAADNALYDVKKSKKGEIALLHRAVISESSLAEATYAIVD